ncbi:hypothetical protein [Methylomicrobium album]|uniref:Uncharacterized protein n=1 Tax=Methylomicrobium album BG8 TaxID=686340 RepID=H8GNK7_METAL|nr:hypothetical protein [Methylomicrobium album]EIC29600.1 hypothetical protein Metal_1833 [Methylomicrobium album BG8]
MLKPEAKHWIVALAVSALLHLILFSLDISFQTIPISRITNPIEVVLIKSPTHEKPISKITKVIPPQASAISNGMPLSNAVSVPSKKNKPGMIPSRHAEKSLPNKTTVAIPPTQPKAVANSVEKQTANPVPKRDWSNIAKEMIRDNADKEIVRDQRQGELWLNPVRRIRR